ncbi:uncharacterized protein TNCV_4205771 [Trichonephila clavipes]|nr:uncharacterized protein TNCV_4205771 [Trichonephila clavipes]
MLRPARDIGHTYAVSVKYCHIYVAQRKKRLNTLDLNDYQSFSQLGAVGSLVVRASDSRPEGLGSMPSNTLRVHPEYVLVKSKGPKSCGLSHERRDWRIFPSPSDPCRNCAGGDRWCRHLSSLRGISPS